MRAKHARQIRRGIIHRRIYNDALATASEPDSVMYVYRWASEWQSSASKLELAAWWRTARYTTRNPPYPRRGNNVSTENFYRVAATVTFAGEWFVPIDENVQTPEHAAEYVRSCVGAEDPENIIEEHAATVNFTDIWVTDEDGERLTNA